LLGYYEFFIIGASPELCRLRAVALDIKAGEPARRLLNPRRGAMNLSRSKAVAATAAVALALSGAISPALARGDRGFHGGGFHGGGFHGGGMHAGGGFHGFHGGHGFAGGGFDHGGGRHGWGHHGWGGGHRGYAFGGYPGWGYGGGYYDPGYAYGYGYDGLGLGFTAALIGGALAASAAPYDSGRTVAYCESRFKSYNRATGTYLGYDGLRHSCP
jgi:hypothetical protein